jgi:hypothetical protein
MYMDAAKHLVLTRTRARAKVGNTEILVSLFCGICKTGLFFSTRRFEAIEKFA